MVAQIQRIQKLKTYLVPVQVDQANSTSSITWSVPNLIPATSSTGGNRTVMIQEYMMAMMQQLLTVQAGTTKQKSDKK